MKNIKINKVISNTKIILLSTVLGTTALFTSCSPKNERANNDYSSETIIDSDILQNSSKNDSENSSYNVHEDSSSTVKNDNSSSNIDNSNTEKTDDNSSSNTEITEIEEDEEEEIVSLPLDINIKYTSSNDKYVRDYIDSIETYYKYEDIFGLDNAINEYNQLEFNNTHPNKLSKLDSTQLYNCVIKNNATVDNFLYQEIDQNTAKNVCEIINDVVTDFIESDSDIDKDNVMCVLSDLKIVINPSALYNACITDDNILVLSPNMLNVAELLSYSNKSVIEHEIIHLLQKHCKCDVEKNSNLKKNYGVSYAFNNLDVNSLDFTWLYESSAEKCVQNYTGAEPMTYIKMINYLESLTLVNLLNDNSYPCEYLSFNKGLENLYEYFNVSTEKDKKELLKMLYSIQIMQASPDDFYNKLSSKDNINIDNKVKDQVNYDLKSSICITLSKLFYSNLSKNIVDKDIKLNDIFYLIKLFEDDISSHNHYDDYNLYNYNEDFFEVYTNIQDNFFYQLSLITGYTQEEISNCFNNYDGYDCKLEFIDKERKEYLEKRKDELYNYSTSTIRKSYQKLLKDLHEVYK